MAKNPFIVGDRVACITNMQHGIVQRLINGKSVVVYWGHANGHDYTSKVPVVDLTLENSEAYPRSPMFDITVEVVQ